MTMIDIKIQQRVVKLLHGDEDSSNTILHHRLSFIPFIFFLFSYYFLLCVFILWLRCQSWEIKKHKKMDMMISLVLLFCCCVPLIIILYPLTFHRFMFIHMITQLSINLCDASKVLSEKHSKHDQKRHENCGYNKLKCDLVTLSFKLKFKVSFTSSLCVNIMRFSFKILK